MDEVRDLYHVTLTTGHVAVTTRRDVADSVIALLRPLVAAGVARLPGPVEWWLIVEPPQPGWRRFHVAPNPDAPPYVTCVGCWQQAASQTAWVAAGQTDEPPPVPWLAVSLEPAILALSPDALGMLGDLERCVFWSLA